ncbi:hypothetical protein HOY80DRAFT_1141564 [Tuber brumale]|nr:hypothetical protein HOY80DRAFT_1141564 [Tuber brumale]
MDKQLDIHHFVALMSYVMENKQTVTSEALDPTQYHFEHSITEDHSTNIRICQVIDTIAGICISEESAEVIAVALQLNTVEKKIRLTLTGNNDLGGHTVFHLSYMWARLQELSSAFARQKEGLPGHDGRTSPDIPAEVGMGMRIEICKEIYTFSAKKQIKIMDKWWNGLCDFALRLIERRGGVVRAMEQTLCDALIVLGGIQGVVSELYRDPMKQDANEEWAIALCDSMWVIKVIRQILAERDGMLCDSLTHEFHDGSEKPFPVRRALEKLSTLPGHIEALIGFASSPRLRPLLQYDLSIATVPVLTHTVQLPTSTTGWQLVLDTARCEYQNWTWNSAQEPLDRYQAKKYESVVHCELQIVRHLETKRGDKWDNIPPFSYIGISKSPSRACRIWLESNNAQGRRRFHTRGCGGKLSWPWAMPRMNESKADTPSKPSVEMIMIETLSNDYAANLESERLESIRTEGREDMFMVGEQSFTEDEEKQILARRAAEREKFQANISGLFESLCSNS